MRSVLVLALMVLTGCPSGLRDGLFSKPGVSYRIGVPPESDWRQVGFAENDLAWVHQTTGHVISTNATCDGHGDAPLEVLTQHLLFGFTERDLKEQKLEKLDGRESLHSRYLAKIDGVEADIEVIVLKKNGCVHDFSYVAPLGHADMFQATFDSLLAGFAQEKSP